MIILDTNVISALMQDPPEPKVITWLDQQVRSSIWTSAVTVFEIQTGLQTMPVGRRQTRLSELFERILNSLDHRIASLDEEAARQAANLTASRQRQGRTVEFRDTMIAGIVSVRRAILATRNTTHFADLSTAVINPWLT